MSIKSKDYLKETLGDLSQENYGKPFDKLGTKEQSDTLSRLFVTRVLEQLGHGDTADRFEDSYTDGGGDLGIDLLIKVGKEAHIIQTKYKSVKHKVPRDAIDSFQTILPRLAAPTAFEKHENSKLKELVEEIEWDKDTIFLWFVTSTILEDQAKSATEMKIEIPTAMREWGLTEERLNYDYIDQERLYQILTESQSPDTPSGVDKVELHTAKQPSKGRSDLILLEEGGVQSVVMVVESEQIANCWKKAKNRLFDFNIRNYLGENKKNKKIYETAKDAPESFFLYNNGVSAICENMEIDKEAGKVSANKFSVINGAQTVRSLAKLKGIASQPKVLLRVTEIPHHKTRGKILKEMITYNNTQNEIKTSDFRSNDLIQKSFKEHFKDLRKNGKKCEYFPKRTEKASSQVYRIDMVDFAKGVFCYSIDPYELQASGQTILFDPSRDYYGKIFGSEDGKVKKDDFLEKAGMFFAWELIGDWVKEQKNLLKNKNDSDSINTKNALERKTILIWMLRHFLERLEKESEDRFSEKKFLRKLAESHNLNLSEESDQMFFFKECLESVKEQVVYKYSELIAEGITQRQWIKGLQGVKDKLMTSVKLSPKLTAGVKQYLGKV